MLDANVTTLIVFAISQIIILAATVAVIRSDTKVLSVRVDALQAELAKLTRVLETLAQQAERLSNVEERQLAQGKRIDELSNRLNQYIDRGFPPNRNQHHRGEAS